jgi:hypothetical protein
MFSFPQNEAAHGGYRSAKTDFYLYGFLFFYKPNLVNLLVSGMVYAAQHCK